jgi:tetratricopeptide (TPR) repeat protein
MLSLLLILFVVAGVYYIVVELERDITPISQKVSKRLERLWQVAQLGMKEKKYLRAEKALLTILKLDQKNAAAYNRLGILYSRQKEYKDAIECFEIASSIEPSASSLHNLGLIYYETENYQKAALAFEAAIKMEDELAARHIAYAKVQEKLEDEESVIKALNRAVELEPNPQTYQLLADAYMRNGNDVDAKKILARRQKVILPSGRGKRVKRSERVVY